MRCAQHAIARLRNKGVHPWIISEREADHRDILLALSNADCVFTVRASYDRYLAAPERQLSSRGVATAAPPLEAMTSWSVEPAAGPLDGRSLKSVPNGWSCSFERA